MTRIYLIRHAEAEGNLFRLCHGQYNSTITPRGYRQLAALRKRFQDIPIDAVYGSDLFRTQTTASAVYLPKGLEFRPLPLLREVNVGIWEEMTWAEIARIDLEGLYNFTHRPNLWKIEGAETYDVVQQRLLAGIRQIAAENPGKTVAATSHAAALRVLLGAIEGKTLEEIGKDPYCENTAVSLLEVEGEEIRILFRDDISHLQGELDTGAARGDSDFGRKKYPELYYDRREVSGALVCDAFVPQQNTDFRGQAGRITLVQEGDALRITDYWIDPGIRGVHLGNQLMGQAVQLARRKGLETVVLTCGSELEAFFARFGFVTGERTGDDCHMALDLRLVLREIPEI